MQLDSCARLGLDHSERIVCQITSECNLKNFFFFYLLNITEFDLYSETTTVWADYDDERVETGEDDGDGARGDGDMVAKSRQRTTSASPFGKDSGRNSPAFRR